MAIGLEVSILFTQYSCLAASMLPNDLEFIDLLYGYGLAQATVHRLNATPVTASAFYHKGWGAITTGHYR